MKAVFKETWNTYDGFIRHKDCETNNKAGTVWLPYQTKGKIEYMSVPGIARRGRIARGFANKLVVAAHESDPMQSTEQNTALNGLINTLLQTDTTCTWNVIPYEAGTARSLIDDERRLIAAHATPKTTLDTVAVARTPLDDPLHNELIPDQAIIGIKATVPARLASLVTGSLACGIVSYYPQPPAAATT